MIRITSRRRNIRNLREQDYKKYEWLLERLNLLYKPQPHDTPRGVLGEKENVARKASIEKLTDLWCSELRRHRLKYFTIFLSTEILIVNPRAYEGTLQEAQPEFLRRKAEKLQFILSEERDLGLEPTVTEQEIEECIKKADEVQRQLEGNVSRDEEYLIYKEDIKEQSIVFQAE